MDDEIHDQSGDSGLHSLEHRVDDGIGGEKGVPDGHDGKNDERRKQGAEAADEKAAPSGSPISRQSG